MALPFATVGAKITASFINSIVTLVNRIGLTSSVATSVAGTSVVLSSSGAVTFSTATAVSVNGCFTSTYDWYVVEFDITTAGAAAMNLTMRASGTDSTTGYDSQRFTTTSAQTLNGASAPLTPSGLAGRHTGTVKIYSPAVAVATIALIFAGETANPMSSAVLYTALIQHRPTTAYDGFTMTASTGTISGTIRITGYNN